MSQVSYTTGTWLAMAGRHTWLLVEMAEDTDLVSRVWSLVRDDAEPDQVLGMILQEGFRVVRNFALVRQRGEEWWCFVRGDATVTADSGTAVTASGVATWVDRDLGPATGVVLAGGEPATGGVRYPLVLGVVPAATVWIGAVPAVAQAEHEQVPVSVPPPDRPQETPADSPRVAESVSRYFGVAQMAPTAPEVEYFTELPEPPEPRVPLPTAAEVAPPAPVESSSPGLITHLAWADRAEAWDPARRDPAPSRNPHAENLDETMLRSHPIDTRPAEPDAGAVRAVRCPDGHLSADTAHACRICATPIPQQQAMTVPRPVLGVLRLSTGDEIALDRGVLLGRGPTAPANGHQRTHLVRLSSEDKQISRNHVEVRLDGWDVLVVDLGAKNGTELHHLDGRREQLEAHTPTVLPPGARVVLDAHTHFTFEVRS